MSETNGTSGAGRTGYYCPTCHNAVISGDHHKCALPEEIEEMSARAAEKQRHAEAFRDSVVRLMEKHSGALGLLDMAEVLDGQTQRLRSEYERIKLAARKVRGRKK